MLPESSITNTKSTGALGEHLHSTKKRKFYHAYKLLPQNLQVHNYSIANNKRNCSIMYKASWVEIKLQYENKMHNSDTLIGITAT